MIAYIYLLYCTILISSARGVTSDHMDEISISANQVGTWDTPKISAAIFRLQSNLGRRKAIIGLVAVAGQYGYHSA